MNFNQAIEAIKTAHHVLLTTHVRPDGDAVGSMVALQRLIDQAAQKSRRPCRTQLLFLSRVPAHYRFLLTEKPWEVSNQINPQPIAAADLDPYDLIIVVDTNAVRQLPGLSDYLIEHPQRVIAIDHHLASDGIGAIRLIDPRRAALGEIIFNLARAADWPLDETAAVALFVALSTDTGWFRFENVSSHTYEIAAALVAAGAQPHLIYRQVFQQFPPARVKLLALTLQTLEMHCDDRLAVMHITRDMLAQTGAKRSYIENMVNEPQQIAAVIVSVLLVEQDDNTTRVSFRSSGEFDVNNIARQFHGGGHAAAAGATLPLPLKDARSQIINALAAAL